MTVKKLLSAFFYSLTILVFSVLYAGLVLSSLIILLSGILRTIGFEQIKMNIWYGVELPVVLSIPVALLFSIFLFYCSKYVKRSIKFCVEKAKF
ncbi:hypothetical protein [Mesobacillus zeae]|uniref:Uncharacterized protein n=1 Tax=Mesobacillus zeae TaxID=1917180 RepID=A0A398BBT9_9BACI|nr:hypothetical protein [Mesobacillus zeae]RID87515.1 hypothetical protein D1970_04920 [Mesobacillus zeae]